MCKLEGEERRAKGEDLKSHFQGTGFHDSIETEITFR